MILLTRLQKLYTVQNDITKIFNCLFKVLYFGDKTDAIIRKLTSLVQKFLYDNKEEVFVYQDLDLLERLKWLFN